MQAACSLVSRHHRWHIRPPTVQSKVCERNLKVRAPCFVLVGLRVGKYSSVVFCPKCCQGVSLVRESSPCSRMKGAKAVCCPGFLPRIADRTYGVVELCLFLANFGNSSPEKWHFSRCSMTAVSVLTEFRAQLCIMSEKCCWCYVARRHKAGAASLQASLAAPALKRWLAYSPALVPVYYRTDGGRICHRKCLHYNGRSAGVFTNDVVCFPIKSRLAYLPAAVLLPCLGELILCKNVSPKSEFLNFFAKYLGYLGYLWR